MKNLESLLSTLTLSTLLAACSSTPPVAPEAASGKTTAAAASPAAPQAAHPAPAPAPVVAAAALPPHKDPNSLISMERSVYFEFDDFSVNERYNGLVERHGKYLQARPELAIRLEGNADERGSAEYNLALGQRRAESLLRALKLIGVKESQMEAVSYGEEKPKASGNSETAWAENRRADVVYRP